MAVVAGALLAGAVCLSAVTVLFWPAYAASFCPRCFGLEPLESQVWIENTATQAQRSLAEQALHEARRRVEVFLGPLHATPVTIVCVSEDCYRRISRAGETRGISYFDLVLVLSPRGINAFIPAHEITHIEFHRLVGFRDVPAWFDEGLAVYVSDDPRYLRPVSAGDRCIVDPSGTLPVSKPDWFVEAGRDHELYAKAACRVARWLAAHGGPAAVTKLSVALANGRSFVDAYALPR
jgi:hypothetical protein